MSSHPDSRVFERAEDFDPVPVRVRVDGWTVERQRGFIRALAETGCVAQAAAEVGMTPRSAFRLAARPDAVSFARAWSWAQSLATNRLTALAFDYAINGVTETVWKDGECVYERRRPSERMLIYLLTHLDPTRFGKAAFHKELNVRDFRETGAEALPEMIGKFTAVPPEEEKRPGDPADG